MPMCELLVDTDVLIKLAAYGLLEAIAHPGCEDDCDRRTGLIGAAKFTSRRALKRKASDPAAATAYLDAFVNRAAVVEPTEAEVALAAELEEAAAVSGGSLDVGESQLCAIAISRGRPTILTGDKRAVIAAEQLIGPIELMGKLKDRIACLEQAFVLITERLGVGSTRAKVIAEPAVDTALSICFQFTNPAVAADFYPHGLRSYIEDLRKAAPTVLLPGQMLMLVQ